MVTRFLARQLGNPSGVFGRLVMSRLLNRGNDELLSGALASLDLEPGDRFLDVGFGGGGALRKAARVVTAGELHGIDRSEDMVEQGRRALADLGPSPVELQLGDVAALPYGDGVIDKLLTTNTVYFWPDLEAGLRECLRVLAPGGRMAVGITGGPKMREFNSVTQHGFRVFEGPDLREKLDEVGFVRTRLVTLHGKVSWGDFVIVGEKG